MREEDTEITHQFDNLANITKNTNSFNHVTFFRNRENLFQTNSVGPVQLRKETKSYYMKIG